MQAERRRGTNQHAILLTNAVSSLQADQKAIEKVKGRHCNLIIVDAFAMIASALNVMKSQKCHIQTNNKIF